MSALLVRARVHVFAIAMFSLLVALGAGVPSSSAAPAEAKIINGNKVAEVDYTGRWPFIVALVRSSEANAYQGQFCGGSLIQPNVVLTAAHCIHDPGSNQPSEVHVITGRRDLNSGAGERIAVSAIYEHPSYNPNDFNNDIALLVLANNSASPTITLVQAGEEAMWGNGAGLPEGADEVGPWVGGWGNMDAAPNGNNYPAEMYEVKVPIKSDAECATPPAGFGSFNPGNMICGSDLDTDGSSATNGQDTCQGDSGGPLMVGDGAAAPMTAWRLAGITSFGEGCASTSYGVYTRVNSFRDWVTTCLADQGACAAAGPLGNPSNLRVTASTLSRVNLAWNQPTSGPAPTSYRIYDDSGDQPELLGPAVSSTSASLKFLIPGRTYWFLVTSIKDGKESAGSIVKATTTKDTQAPSRPGKPKASKRTTKSVTLVWKASKDNDAVRLYDVYQKKGKKWRRIDVVSGPKVVIKRLKRGTKYQFRVQAFDWVDNASRPSAVAAVRTKG